MLWMVEVARLADELIEGPEAEDVKAGWLGFSVFLLLVAAVVFLSFSLVKQLRKAQAAKDAGVYGDDPAAAEPAPEEPAEQPPLDERRG